MARCAPLIALLAVSPLAAQTRPASWGLGAAVGPAFPSGQLASSFNPGVSGMVYFTYRIAPRLAFGFDVGTSRLPGVHGGHSDFPEVMIGLLWRPAPPQARVRPFFLGGVGSLALNGSDPDAGNLAFAVGAGASIGGPGMRGFVLLRCLRTVTGTGATIVPLLFGVSTRSP